MCLLPSVEFGVTIFAFSKEEFSWSILQTRPLHLLYPKSLGIRTAGCCLG